MQKDPIPSCRECKYFDPSTSQCISSGRMFKVTHDDPIENPENYACEWFTPKYPEPPELRSVQDLMPLPLLFCIATSIAFWLLSIIVAGIIFLDRPFN